MRSSRWTSLPVLVPLVFAAWTLFVWVGRIRNLAQEPGGLGDAGRWSLWGSVVFSVLGFGLLALVVADRVRPGGAPVRWLVAPLAGFTTFVWVIRAIDIAGGDHSAGFIAVHLVLAAVSIALAAASVQVVPVWPGDRPAPVPADAPVTGEGDRSTVGYPRSDG